ncbi:conserved hypothetical protein [Methylocella silvestris BL2]|uniref:Uncharacterized protein n=1 Tax=Methylocella silvestris (strain DSM 15510 / CIP 108128 / LMG 27833 / NCIMB 13906 / BL2) TaxID=395965 RepID=B8ER79_METSB|nr:hypothetical protein [Methylocella silvestris]ACK50263.1 conserved hypothetical protein [Methylocella silvestris BL2]
MWEPEKPKLDLIGVVHGPLLSMAVFLDETNHSLVRLRIGQSFHGWTVHELDTRGATLEKAEQKVKLKLPDHASGKYGAASLKYAPAHQGTDPIAEIEGGVRLP